MATNGRYGYFRDELYFLACSDHLAWAYVDFAPLVALVTHISRFVLGDSLHALRLFPALAQGRQILITALITRELLLQPPSPHEVVLASGSGRFAPLPQHFGDEFGWEEMVASTAQVYNSLPPDLRAKTCILAGTYGDAGAIDSFGPRYGLPKSISPHQHYYLWGPRQSTGESLILLHYDLEDARRACQSVQEGPSLSHLYAMQEEHHTILVCRNAKLPLSQAWPLLKVWN